MQGTEWEEHDYTGVLLQELRQVVLPRMEQLGVKPNNIAVEPKKVPNGVAASRGVRRTDLDTREIARILFSAPQSAVIGLHKADQILRALGLNINGLALDDKLHVVPLDAHMKNARRMAEDEYWVQDIVPTDLQVQARAVELRSMKAELVAQAKLVNAA